MFLTIVAYNHNQTSIYQINGQAYGTSWSVVSSQYIGDHHKNNIINIINNIDFVASNYKNNSEISKNLRISSTFYFKKLDKKDFNYSKSFNPNKVKTNREKYVIVNQLDIFERIYIKI